MFPHVFKPVYFWNIQTCCLLQLGTWQIYLCNQLSTLFIPTNNWPSVLSIDKELCLVPYPQLSSPPSLMMSSRPLLTSRPADIILGSIQSGNLINVLKKLFGGNWSEPWLLSKMVTSLKCVDGNMLTNKRLQVTVDNRRSSATRQYNKRRS